MTELSASGEVSDDVASDPVGGTLIAVLDDLFAPLVRAVEQPEHHVDPVHAPEAMIRWLGNVLGVDDERVPSLVRRRQLTDAFTAHRRRGTIAGITALARLFHSTAEITEHFGNPPTVHIRLALTDPDLAEPLHDALTSSLPVHVRATIEITTDATADRRRR